VRCALHVPSAVIVKRKPRFIRRNFGFDENRVSSAEILDFDEKPFFIRRSFGFDENSISSAEILDFDENRVSSAEILDSTKTAVHPQKFWI
jgi:hypothetical protein